MGFSTIFRLLTLGSRIAGVLAHQTITRPASIAIVSLGQRG